MFPVSDFNFMVAGIATFAATVGYTYARKLNTMTRTGLSDNNEIRDHNMAPPDDKAQSDPPEKASISMEVEPSSITSRSPTRRESLKRKEPHSGFEEEDSDLGYPFNLANIYPRKRCRTPSTDSNKEGENSLQESAPLLFSEDSVTQEDWIFIQPINSPNTVLEDPPRTPSPGPETLAAPTPAADITDSPLVVPASIHAETKHEQGAVSSKAKGEDTTATDRAASNPEPKTEQAQEVEKRDLATPAPAPASSPAKLSLQKPISSPFKTRGFAEFAGTKSPFGAFTVSQGSGLKSNRAIWSAPNAGESSFGTPATRSEDSDENDDTSSSGSGQHALAQAPPVAKPANNHVTGEENEDVEMELKGVKLFVKRGDKPFAEGIAGRIKLLSDRTTLDERLLFRREPLWKVSMNVRVSPSVMCTYDSTEHVLRLITQERPIAEGGSKDEEKLPLEIVVYAMKPGRSCSKQDFAEFSETLMKNSRLKSPASSNSS